MTPPSATSMLQLREDPRAVGRRHAQARLSGAVVDARGSNPADLCVSTLVRASHIEFDVRGGSTVGLVSLPDDDLDW